MCRRNQPASPSMIRPEAMGNACDDAPTRAASLPTAAELSPGLCRLAHQGDTIARHSSNRLRAQLSTHPAGTTRGLVCRTSAR